MEASLVDTPILLSTTRAFDCDILRFSHTSPTLGNLSTKWHAIVPRPASDSSDTPLPLLYFLSGLTCTDENFVQKAGAARAAALHRIAVVAPDTSPRGAGAPDEDASWDFGTGAGFYVDATAPEYATHYNMYSFVLHELPRAVAAALQGRVDTTRAAVCGHSMGGHGALVLALRNPDVFRSCSAFAPICNPAMAPWGHKCFGKYLGEGADAWKQYDATELMRKRGAGNPLFSDGDILVDQGAEDSFLQEQLMPHKLETACKEVGQKLNMRIHEGYSHDYFFVQTFIDEHIAHHANFLHK